MEFFRKIFKIIPRYKITVFKSSLNPNFANNCFFLFSFIVTMATTCKHCCKTKYISCKCDTKNYETRGYECRPNYDDIINRQMSSDNMLIPDMTCEERGIIDTIKTIMRREKEQQQEYIETLKGQIFYLKADVEYLQKDVTHKNNVIESLLGKIRNCPRCCCDESDGNKKITSLPAQTTSLQSITAYPTPPSSSKSSSDDDDDGDDSDNDDEFSAHINENLNKALFDGWDIENFENLNENVDKQIDETDLKNKDSTPPKEKSRFARKVPALPMKKKSVFKRFNKKKSEKARSKDNNNITATSNVVSLISHRETNVRLLPSSVYKRVDRTIGVGHSEEDCVSADMAVIYVGKKNLETRKTFD